MNLNIPIIAFILALSLYLALRAVRSRMEQGSFSSFENTILGIRVPKENEKEALAAEQMFASLHGMLKLTPVEQEHFTFEIVSDEKGINFYAAVPKHLKEFLSGQIYAQYPEAEIFEVEEYTTLLPNPNLAVSGATISLIKDQLFPIKTFRDFEVDPLGAITSAIADLRGGLIWWQLLIRPVGDVWQEAGHAYVETVRAGKSPVALNARYLFKALTGEVFEIIGELSRSLLRPGSEVKIPEGSPKVARVDLSAGLELALKLIENKLSKMGFEVAVRVITAASTKDEADNYLRRITATFRQFAIANLNSFDHKIIASHEMQNFIEHFKRRDFPEDSYVLTTEELASLFHFPNVSVETPAIAWSPAKRGEPPLELPISDCVYFAKTTYREQLAKFGIKRDDRRRHIYVIGKTGTGKSNLLKNLVAQDMQNGEGLAVLDPHGQLIDDLLDLIPDHRVEDVVLLDPSDLEHPIGINMFENPDPAQKNLMASGLVDVFKKEWGDISWGPRLEYLLNNAILTLLEVPRTTLLGITRLLSDQNYQKYIVYKIFDPVIRDFWEKEFKEMKGNQRLITEAIAPIQNKVGRFLASTTIRNILGQATSSIDFSEIINEGKILLVNLSKGKIGEDNSNLLGSLIITRLNFMAMQRVRIPEEERRDFYIYADEFQNFASGSFGAILSEARKYRLSLVLAHQYTAQLPESMLRAIFGNVGTIVPFALGAQDAALLAPEFAPVFDENDLISLEKYHFYIKLMIDGMTSAPFSAIGLEPPTRKTFNREKVIELSRRKYSRERARVEDLIKRWSEKQFDLGSAKAEEARSKGSLKEPEKEEVDAVVTLTVPSREVKPETHKETGFKKSVENPKKKSISGEIIFKKDGSVEIIQK